MRSSRALLCSIAALVGAAVLAPAAPAQEPLQDRCPQPGDVLVGDAGSGADHNGNGLVCADPETGEFSDDVGPRPRDYDRNENQIVCYNAQSGAIVDDRPPAEGEIEPRCPTSFGLLPVLLP